MRIANSDWCAEHFTHRLFSVSFVKLLLIPFIGSSSFFRCLKSHYLILFIYIIQPIFMMSHARIMYDVTCTEYTE